MALDIEVVFFPHSVKNGEKTKILYKIKNDTPNKYVILERRGEIKDTHGNILQSSKWQPINIIINKRTEFEHSPWEFVDPTEYYSMKAKGRYFLRELLKIDGPDGNFQIEKIAEITIL